MATETNGKRTTLADLMAAAKVGALDPSTEVVPLADVAGRIAAAYDNGAADGVTAAQRAMPVQPTSGDGTDHECALPGCRHGATGHGSTTPQPDRQLKLACPACGAVARMTASAAASSTGILCNRDGALFMPAARRAYTRKEN